VIREISVPLTALADNVVADEQIVQGNLCVSSEHRCERASLFLQDCF
jgi:hypothetical protein